MAYAIYLSTHCITGKEIGASVNKRIVVGLRWKIRDTCLHDIGCNPIFVDGHGGWTIQIDESLLNHKPKRIAGRPRGRRPNDQIWVFGILETRPPAPGRGIYQVVPTHGRRTLTIFYVETTSPFTLIVGEVINFVKSKTKTNIQSSYKQSEL